MEAAPSDKPADATLDVVELHRRLSRLRETYAAMYPGHADRLMLLTQIMELDRRLLRPSKHCRLMP